MAGSYIEVVLPDAGRMPAYVVEATGGERRAGLVLLQEIFGVNGNMREAAEAFALGGYDVIVPDLFWRQEPRVELNPTSEADRDRAAVLMKQLDQAQAMEDALAAAIFLRGTPHSSGKTGAVGYCLGGKLAFLLARSPEVTAAVSYYGVAIQASLDQSDQLVAPLLLHIAKDDALCPPAAQAAIHAALDERENVDIIDYPGVGHAFARYGGTAFDKEAAGRAELATTNFLRSHMGA